MTHIIGKRRRSRLVATTALAVVLTFVAPLALQDCGIPDLAGPAAAKCCFTGDTLVLLADGREISIRKVREGDLVTSGIGGMNRVVGIEAVPLGERELYKINDSEAFFTQEHPFLTKNGWCSVNPLASYSETPSLEVKPMIPGDVFVCASNGPVILGNTALAPDLSFFHVILTSLDSVRAPADEIVYNLLLDGDHTYVANGFVVHNKDGDGGDGGGGGEGGDSDGGEGGDSGSGEGGDSDGGEGGDSGGDSGGGEGGDSDGGEGGDSGGGEGGDSDGGEGGDSGGEGGDSDGGEGGESGDSDGGEGGDSDGGEGGESGSGGETGFDGNADPAGPDLTSDQERDLISRGWD